MSLNIEIYKTTIFNLKSVGSFEQVAIEAFNFQYHNNLIYHQYCELIKIQPEKVTTIEEIPFLPIEFFKSNQILCGNSEVQTIFTSSGTTGNMQSKHYVTDLSFYENSFYKAFQYFYGELNEFCILGLLPSYIERKGSSLIYMVNELIKNSGSSESGFFLYDLDALFYKIQNLESQGRKYLLIGVSFALLDFVEKYKISISNGIVMETGGMKGRRKEITRDELHTILKTSFGVKQIHSEYGMTELLSQAYSKADGVFNCPAWMKVLCRDTNDPFTINKHGTGALNIIDLANINSCCFVETSDLGKINKDGSFEVTGRFDSSDVRGCNLMVI
jgi:hypothetical protein